MNNNGKNSFAPPAVFELRLESLLPHYKTVFITVTNQELRNPRDGIAHVVGKARTLASEVKMEMHSLSRVPDKL